MTPQRTRDEDAGKSAGMRQKRSLHEMEKRPARNHSTVSPGATKIVETASAGPLVRHHR
jgi:hypothetical protein